MGQQQNQSIQSIPHTVLAVSHSEKRTQIGTKTFSIEKELHQHGTYEKEQGQNDEN